MKKGYTIREKIIMLFTAIFVIFSLIVLGNIIFNNTTLFNVTKPLLIVTFIIGYLFVIFLLYKILKKNKKKLLDKKILIIDADLQANMTQFLYKTNHTDKTIVNAIRDNAAAEEIIIKSPNSNYPNIDLIPADIELCILSEEMALKDNKNKLAGIWFKRNI